MNGRWCLGKSWKCNGRYSGSSWRAAASLQLFLSLALLNLQLMLNLYSVYNFNEEEIRSMCAGIVAFPVMFQVDSTWLKPYNQAIIFHIQRVLVLLLRTLFLIKNLSSGTYHDINDNRKTWETHPQSLRSRRGKQWDILHLPQLYEMNCNGHGITWALLKVSPPLAICWLCAWKGRGWEFQQPVVLKDIGYFVLYSKNVAQNAKSEHNHSHQKLCAT